MIEQITFLMYARLLDINETRDENREKRSGKSFQRRFKDDEQNLRWSQFRHLGAEEMLPIVRDKVFPHFKTSSASGSAFAEFMKDIRKDYDQAEKLYRQTLEIDPNNANNTGNLALFMNDIRKDYVEAEKLYRRALELDPNHSNNTGNFAIFMQTIHKDQELWKVFLSTKLFDERTF